MSAADTQITQSVDDYVAPLSPAQFQDESLDAELRGFNVVLGDDHTLLLDMDGPLNEVTFARASELFGLVKVDEWPSKSGLPHRHVVVRTEYVLSVEARIALQAIVGSDPMRELMSLARARNGIGEPNRLFAPKNPNPKEKS